MKNKMMVWMLGAALWLLPLLGQAQPRIEHPVTDPSHFLSAGDTEDLSRRMVAHREATHVQMAVLVVPTTDGEPIEDYSHRAAEQWAGGQAGQDNGLLVVLAVRDHHSRIEVGRGLEAQATDGETRQLLDNARPALRASNYGEALRGIVNGLVRETGGTVLTAQAAPVDPTAPRREPIRVRPQPEPQGDDSWLVPTIVIGGLFAAGLLAYFLLRSNDKSRGYRGSYDYPTYGSSNYSRTGGYNPRPSPRVTTPPPPPRTPEPVRSTGTDAVAVGAGVLAGAAAGVAVGAAVSELRREPAQRYDIGSDPKLGSRSYEHTPSTAGPSYTPPTPPAKKPEKKRDTPRPSYSSSYESPKRNDSPAFGSSIFGGSSYGSSSSSRDDSSSSWGSSSSSSDSSSSSSSDWGGGGGSFDGGGSSSDW
jgi:uncharacterized protein